MVQGEFIKKKLRLTKRRIVILITILGVIIAVIAFCGHVPKGPMVLPVFPPHILAVLFPILVFLPVSAILLSISAGLGKEL